MLYFTVLSSSTLFPAELRAKRGGWRMMHRLYSSLRQTSFWTIQTSWTGQNHGDTLCIFSLTGSSFPFWCSALALNTVVIKAHVD